MEERTQRRSSEVPLASRKWTHHGNGKRREGRCRRGCLGVGGTLTRGVEGWLLGQGPGKLQGSSSAHAYLKR